LSQEANETNDQKKYVEGFRVRDTEEEDATGWMIEECFSNNTSSHVSHVDLD
jgi:hypothetical protein